MAPGQTGGRPWPPHQAGGQPQWPPSQQPPPQQPPPQQPPPQQPPTQWPPQYQFTEATPAQPQAPPQYPYYPPQQAPPPPPPKPEPWGAEDPILWCARRARFHSVWGMAAVSLFLTLFGLGCYKLISTAYYEGAEELEGMVGTFLMLILSPIFLSIVGGVASGALFRTARRMRDRSGAPEGLRLAVLVLGFSTLLFVLLFPVFIGLATVKGGEEGDFPLGLFAYLPVYMGLCVAFLVSGSALLAWSRLTRVESGLVILLGWAALLVTLIAASTINPDNFDPANIDKFVFWVMYGPVIASLLPWLTVLGLWYAHGRQLGILEGALAMPPGAATVPSAATTKGPENGLCPKCGATMAVYPRTGVTFCPACGHGLAPEPEAPWPPSA